MIFLFREQVKTTLVEEDRSRMWGPVHEVISLLLVSFSLKGDAILVLLKTYLGQELEEVVK